MRNYISFFLLALPLFASASTYTLDLSSATPADASAPVLRHSSLPLDGLSNVRPALQVGDTIHLTLFPDTSFALEVVSAPPPGIAGQSFIARDPSSSASAVVKVTKSGIRISIDDFMRSLQYTVRCKDGLIDIFERDNSQVDPGECGTCQGSVDTPIIEPAETTSSTPATRRLLGTSGNAFPAASQKSVVDILVAFDQGAVTKSSELGYDTIEDFADYAVNKMNMVLEKSELLDVFCYRLVGVVKIDGSWTAINNALLLSMRAREGKFANLDQLRDKYGADTITLLIDRTSGNTSGIGFEYSGDAGKTLEYFENMKYGCNVCDINTVYSRYTMSHETGHNMGCGHSNRQGSNSGPGRYSDSCGYHFTDANSVRRGTVMAYTYSGDDNYYYEPSPYFSTPDITPEEYGCALGVAGVNNNRRTLTLTHTDIASLREHVLPYDWDVKFLDNNGKEIPDGAYFYGSCYVTLTNDNSEAEIYYTLDGSIPNQDTTTHGAPGTKVYVYLTTGSKTLTACAVVDGVAQSVRSITLNDGLTWSGDKDGNGVWVSGNSETPWSGEYFYNDDPVVFPDLDGIASATVTVQDAVSPDSVWFRACETSYTFAKGSDSARINLKDAAFVPSGNLTFNVPVKMDALVFTNQTGTALTFNAPFGQTLDSSSGSCTNVVTISKYGTLTVAPGNEKTQTLKTLNTSADSTSTFRVGEGTVVFNGDINGGAGVTGRTKLEVGNGGSLIFNQGGATGYDMNETSLTIEKGGSVTFNKMEHMKRTVYLDGGTIYAKRFDLISNPGVYVTDNSSIENNTGGYILCRDSDSEINVSAGKTLTLNVGTQTDNRSDTSGWGIVKKGGGTIVANAELKHSGVTQIDEGTIEVGYSSGTTTYGLGWTVVSNATLRVKSGCSLKVPTLTLDPTATISVPAANSAPLIVNGNVDLTEVRIAMHDVGDLSLGASYPLIKSTGEISGLKSFIRENWPQPATGLGWKVVLSDGTLTASIVNIVDADPYVNFMTNIAGLLPSIPDDATMTADGGLQIASSPIVIDGLATNAIAVTLDITLGEPSATERTICSWKIGDNIVRCVVTNGVLDCFWSSNSHVKNDADFLSLSPGRHVVNIAYKSLSDDTYGGTFVYADGQLAYRAAGLRWSNDSVSRVTIGTSADDTPAYKYEGLVVNGLALLTPSANEPLPNMTSSGGAVTYDYFAAKSPCVFSLAPSGGFSTHDTLVSAAFQGSYDEMSVSVVAAFPEDVTGTIVSPAVLDGYYAYSTQVEYQGDGVFAFRDNGGNNIKSSVQTDVDLSKSHLYTLTYKTGEGFRLYLDGDEILTNDAYFKNKSLPVYSRIIFGCGYWTNWMTSYNDNPNPMSEFTVYASHIALGTSDRTVSETIVQEATDYEAPEEILPPTTPAVVDVLVAYDLSAQDYVANKSQTLEAFAQIQIDLMNDVLVTNELDRFYTYRLAGVCKVNKTYTNINTAPALIAAGEGPAVSLRAAREIYGADTVTLLVDTTGNTIGNSSPLNSTDNVASQHECAFSVCSIRAVDTGKQHTMIHENAHNMGCGHARAQGVINSPFEYGRGYYFDDNGTTRHTIMAYGGDNDASWYFSTASGKSRFGLKLGDADNNNARVLRETCAEVAKWREVGADNIDVSVAGGSATWQTGKKYPWYVDSDGYVRSYNQTDYTNPCTTPLKATITGPKRLTFKHKSYFGGASVSENDYSHFDVLLDDSPVLAQNECNNSWTEASVYIPEGSHEVSFVFSQRYAMNNPFDYKGGTPEANDAVWLKDFVLADFQTVECTHSSKSDDVEWVFPYDFEATAIDGNLAGVEVGSKGIVESLNFSTNAVCASVLAELPEGAAGIIIGCQLKRSSETLYAFAYSNGNGTFSLGHTDTTDTATSSEVENWTAPHVWTFAFGAQTGAKLYCDGKEIASTTVIQWASSEISGPITFGNDRRNKYPLPGMKIYSVHTDFGVGSAIFKSTDDSANQTMQSLGVLADFAGENAKNQVAAFNLYNATGSIDPEVTHACVLRISEIMPKPTDDQNPGEREGMDVNGLESGWVEVENTSADKWADLADYRFIRTNRGKKTNIEEPGNLPSRLVPPHSRTIFYTSERYPNSDTPEESAFQNVVAEDDRVKPVRYPEYGNIIVYGKKVNPKKSPFVRLYHMPDEATTNVVDTVVIPSDLPEGWSIIVGDANENEGTRRWMCPTPTRGMANTATGSLKRIGPNVGPLYEISSLKKTDVENEFARPAPPAKPGEDYTITLPINPVMNPDGTFSPRTKDKIESIKLVYRKDLDDTTLTTNEVAMTKATDKKAWGDQYTATIPSSFFPAAGHLIQWKVLITDGEGVEWTSPSFNNPDDGYEWYGTIVEAPALESATLPTWHMFASGYHLTQMDVDKDDQNTNLVPNYARIAIYDSSTSNYYDYVRIDLRGNTSAGFTKKGHGLRFAKAHPLTMTDIVSGQEIEGIRKTSLISEYADPSYMRQMIAFWLWNKMGNKVPFDFPVRCNLNGAFYQLAFNSERFTDELIEDVYKLDKFGYSYKNVGTLKSNSGTTAGGIEKKTPDDEDESNITVLQNELRAKITAAQSVSSSPDGGNTGLDNADLTKFVVQKFDLPAWINYLASARITQEMDDVWANVCAYYDNPDMLDGGARGTGTWMPLGYDFNLSFGQYYYNDIKDYGNNRDGLMANQDWFKSHPFYGGNRVKAYRNSSMVGEMDGNDGFESVLQSSKFRRLFLRRLRTLMDQELKAPGTAEADTPFMAKMREMAELMRADAALDQAQWPDNNTDDAIDVWRSETKPVDMDAGIDDIWNNYVVPRREHLYVTHSVTNTTKAVGYGSNLNAGIPEAQSPMDVLAPKIVLDLSGKDLGYIAVSNLNDEVVDMSGWKLKFGVEWTLPPGTVCDANDCIYIVRDRRAFIANPPVALTDQVIIGNASFDDIIANVFLNSADNEPLKGLSSEEGAVVFDAKNQAAADEAVADIAPTLTQEQQNDGLDVQYLKVEAQPTATKGKYQAVVVLNPETVAPPAVKTDMSGPVEIEDDTTDPDQKTVSITVSNAIKGLWYGYAVTDDLSTAFVDDASSFRQADDNTLLRITGSSRDKSKESEFFLIKVMLTQPPTE